MDNMNLAFVKKVYATLCSELPNTYPKNAVRNPRSMYVRKTNENPKSGLLKYYDKYDFEVFRPYVEECSRDSQAVYFQLRPEYR